jgi:hypothetical protein
MSDEVQDFNAFLTAEAEKPAETQETPAPPEEIEAPVVA